MVETLSPIAPLYRPGLHGNVADGARIALAETRPGSIVQVAAWPGKAAALIAAIGKATGLKLADGAGAGIATENRSAFGFAPGRFLLVDQVEGLADRLAAHVPADIGTVTTLSHGRTAFRVSSISAAGNEARGFGGRKIPNTEWVLGKLFALDFALPAFPVGAGRATIHHDIHVMIQRVADYAFDLYVFRSFARSFWKAMCHASEELGYEVR